MITEHTHSENNDWQGPVGEQLLASETSAPPPTVDGREQKAEIADLAPETPATSAGEGEVSASIEAEAQSVQQEEAHALPASDEQEIRPGTPESLSEGPETSLDTASASEHTNTNEHTNTESFEHATPSLFAQETQQPAQEETGVRPFTDFIEEFRQTEERFSALLNEPERSFTAFAAGSESIQEPVVFLETPTGDLTHVVDDAPALLNGVEQKEQKTEAQDETTSTAVDSNEAVKPVPPAERPVSPLLRPATRIRLPRHSRHRVEEPALPVELPKPPVEQAVEETPVAAEAAVEEQPVRPARRYRFDRPAAVASASLASAKTPAPSARGTEAKEKQGANLAARKENDVSSEQTPPRLSAATEAPAQKPPVQEEPPTSAETATQPAPTSERRRRGNNHDRQREKEQVAAAPVPEPVAPVIEPEPIAEAEVPVEDLPPLEYSELQAASSRRRRRRRAGTASTTVSAGANGALPPKATPPELSAPAAPPASALALPKNAPVQSAYNIVSGYTVSQMNQGNDVTGPFMGPEPSPARGSTFGSASPLRPVRGEALRSTPGHPVKHGESPLMSSTAINHLANAVSQAIQVQTDRMVAELRRSNQVPTNVSVSLPPFPSTERVGVFVDVANLLYSARTLRMTVDFGKLLDFLRGNRRLVRAQAYCPTSPQPGDDQMFLQAVKGLGYRITTKNYKTFSSGAKKADLDLDLCMDVVRLVDGKAVDCIVLVSGDSDFMPMLDYCSDHGVRVEVAAFDESMSATLRQSCDLFINLSMLEEIRA